MARRRWSSPQQVSPICCSKAYCAKVARRHSDYRNGSGRAFSEWYAIALAASRAFTAEALSVAIFNFESPGKVFKIDRELALTTKILDAETSRVYGEMIKGPSDGSVSSMASQLAKNIGDTIAQKADTLQATSADSENAIQRLKGEIGTATLMYFWMRCLFASLRFSTIYEMGHQVLRETSWITETVDLECSNYDDNYEKGVWMDIHSELLRAAYRSWRNDNFGELKSKLTTVTARSFE